MVFPREKEEGWRNDADRILYVKKVCTLALSLTSPVDPENQLQFLNISMLFKGTLCPARWIRSKLGTFDRPKLKSEARIFFEKTASPPCCESPLKLNGHLVRLLAI
jgi:hypothetical protein